MKNSKFFLWAMGTHCAMLLFVAVELSLPINSKLIGSNGILNSIFEFLKVAIEYTLFFSLIYLYIISKTYINERRVNFLFRILFWDFVICQYKHYFLEWNGGDQSLVLEYFVRYYMPLVNIVRLILFFLIYRLAINKFKRQLKWISALKIAALLIIFLFSTDIIDDNEYFLAFFTSTFFQIFNKVLIVLPEFILLMIAYKLHFNKDRDLNIEIEAI